MRGSITRRGKAWRLKIDVNPDPVTGARRYVTRTVHGTKSDAEAALTALLAEASAGVTLGHTGTLGELLDRWFAGAHLAPSTRNDYDSAMRNHIPAALRKMPVWKLHAHDLDALYTHLLAQGVGPIRIRRVHNIISAALKQAVKWGWIARNPAVDASPPPLRRKEPNVPTVDEVRQILAAADEGLAVFLRLSAHLGARRGEVCALQWSDVDIAAGQLTIRRAWSDGGRGVGMVLKGTKTDRSRTIALDRLAGAMLTTWHRRLAELALSAGGHPGPWVFPADPFDGTTAVRPDRMTHRFEQLRTNLHLRTDLELRHLRHFAATVLLAAGHDPKTVSGRLGHARTSTTLDIYAAWVPARDRDAADELGRLLG